MQAFADEFLMALAMLAPFMMLGFCIAGFLHAFVPRRLLVRAMGGTGLGPIIRASLVGIPLPLCSCSVVPVAAELRRQGAGRGATAAFMVSTPETGVDSIATSIAVLHPVIVVFRPIAAMVTAVLTGLAVERFAPDLQTGTPVEENVCCDHDANQDVRGPSRGLLGGLRYAFDDLLGEIAPYLVPALLIAALLGVAFDPAQLSDLPVTPWLQRLIMLLAGIPIYVCATSATPVAAAMIVAGISPGAALVFLLAGPATNIVTISAVRQNLGKRSAVVYTATVGIVSYVCGTILDVFWSDMVSTGEFAAQHHPHLNWVHWISAAVLGSLVLWHIARKILRRWRARQ